MQQHQNDNREKSSDPLPSLKDATLPPHDQQKEASGPGERSQEEALSPKAEVTKEESDTKKGPDNSVESEVEKEKASFRARLTSGFKALAYAWKEFPVLSSLNLGTSVARAAMPFIAINYTGKVIDALQTSSTLSPEVISSGLAVVGTIAAASFINSISGVLSRTFQDKLQISVTERLQKSNANRAFQTLQDPDERKEFTFAKNELFRYNNTSHSLYGFLTSGAEVGVAAALIAQHDLVALGLISAFAVPRAFVGKVFGKKQHELDSDIATDEKSYFWRRWALLDFKIIRDKKMLASERTSIEELKRKGNEWNDKRVRLMWRQHNWSLAADVLSYAALGLGMFHAIGETAAGAMTIGALSVVLATSQRLYASLANFFGTGVGLNTDLHYVDSIENYCRRGEDLEQKTRENKESSQIQWQDGVEIKLTNLSFAYPANKNSSPEQAPKKILENVNLTIKPGTLVGVVGENGAGKSTLANLIAGLLPPTEGEISFNGLRQSEIPADEFCDNVTAQFQDARLVPSHTLRELIAEGLPKKRPGVPVEQAAELGGVMSFVRAGDLKDGLDTVFGAELGGQELSGGQAQSVLSSRTIARDAAVMILDEPTSALDGEREKALVQNLIHSRHTGDQKRTTIVVSHAFGTLQDADLILVIGKEERGIIEQGSHKELMRNPNSTYRQLYLKKALPYLEGSMEIFSPEIQSEIREILTPKEDAN